MADSGVGHARDSQARWYFGEDGGDDTRRLFSGLGVVLKL